MEQDLKRLIDLTNGKNVCIMGLGHSLEEIDSKIEMFRGLDVVWIAINEEAVPNKILSKIGKSLDVLTAYPVEMYRKLDLPCLVLRSSLARGNSLSELLHQLDSPKMVFLVGCEGRSYSEHPYYQSDYGSPYVDTCHMHDIEDFNTRWADKVSAYPLWNTCMRSEYCLPKLSLSAILGGLNGNKKAG